MLDNNMARRKTTEQFVAEARQVHGNRYDYSKAEYKKASEKVCIICPKHGEFWQLAKSHLDGRGCHKCGKEIAAICGAAASDKKRKTTEQFIEEARKVHGSKYDYSKASYNGAHVKVCIICPEHGEFWQTPAHHLSGQGCQACVGNAKLTTKQFIAKARNTHGNRYDYSKAEYINNRAKVCIICPEHGPFWQTPNKHLAGRGCPKCVWSRFGKYYSKTTEQFIEKARKIHGDKYDYSKVEYNRSSEKVRIICPRHGEFEQLAGNHIYRERGCPRCATRISKPEQEITDWIRSFGFEVIQSYKKWYDKKPTLEIDIFIPELKLGIEYNGNCWHSSKFHPDPKWHQQEKMLLAAEAGIRLVTVQEHHWLNSNNIVKNIIKNALGRNDVVVSARKCKMEEISPQQAREFHEINHIHGFIGATVHLALKYDNDVVSVMSLVARKGQWEIARYSSSCLVRGGFSKLFRAFERRFGPEVVISYADARFWAGYSYRSAGFVLDGITDPGYCYTDGGQLIYSRQQLQKHKLKRLFGGNFDENLTEEENCARNGLYRLYDCGHWKWVWKKGES